jgi:hypothetical protein
MNPFLGSFSVIPKSVVGQVNGARMLRVLNSALSGKSDFAPEVQYGA